MNAIAHALAHGGPNACPVGTVHAKTREGKAQHHTAPQGKFFGVETSPSIVQIGDERSRRFWAKVKFAQGDSCWEWMGEKNHRGYGRFTFQGVRTVAHRVSHEITKGRVPDGLQCGHLCHNPGCVRPSHLEAMTVAKNIAQRDERLGRTPGSPLSPAERARRSRERARIRREQERIESGWWVSI